MFLWQGLELRIDWFKWLLKILVLLFVTHDLFLLFLQFLTKLDKFSLVLLIGRVMIMSEKIYLVI